MPNIKKYSAIALLAGIFSNTFAAEHLWRDRLYTWNISEVLYPTSPPGVWLIDAHPSTMLQPHSNWNVDDFIKTGINPHPLFQASVDPNQLGATSVQWKKDRFGAFIHTWSVTPSPDPNVKIWSIPFGGLINNGYNYAWDTNMFGPNPQLCSSVYQKVSYIYTEPNAAIYNVFTLILGDDLSNSTLHIVISLWDSRGPSAVGEYIGADYLVGPFVGTYAGGTLYSTLLSGSQSVQEGERPEEFYGVCITRQNIINMANDFNNGAVALRNALLNLATQQPLNQEQQALLDAANARINNPLSNNPSNYRLIVANIQPEAGNLRAPYSNGHVGFGMRSYKVFTKY